MNRGRSIRVLGAVALGAAATCAVSSAASPVTVPTHLSPHRAVHVTFHPRHALPVGGYYYAVAVLVHYAHARQSEPPRLCAVSSSMTDTAYAVPYDDRPVTLVMSPAQAAVAHGRRLGPSAGVSASWCPDGTYLGAIYAVPHPPPCSSYYPCRVTTHAPCAGIAPGCVKGVVAHPIEPEYRERGEIVRAAKEQAERETGRSPPPIAREEEDRLAIERRPYSYFDGLPAPLDRSTRVVAHFRLHFK